MGVRHCGAEISLRIPGITRCGREIQVAHVIDAERGGRQFRDARSSICRLWQRHDPYRTNGSHGQQDARTGDTVAESTKESCLELLQRHSGEVSEKQYRD